MVRVSHVYGLELAGNVPHGVHRLQLPLLIRLWLVSYVCPNSYVLPNVSCIVRNTSDHASNSAINNTKHDVSERCTYVDKHIVLLLPAIPQLRAGSVQAPATVATGAGRTEWS